MTILGFSHLCVSAHDPVALKSWIRMLGYKERFCEPSVPNPLEKRRFLAQSQSHHSLTFFTKPGFLNIEVIEYPTVAGDAKSPLIPVLADSRKAGHRSGEESFRRFFGEMSSQVESWFGSSITFQWVDELCTWAVVVPESPARESGILSLIVRANGEGSSSDPLRKLGFQGEFRGGKVSLARTLPSMNLSLFLCGNYGEVGHSEANVLDGAGVTALAFHSSDLLCDYGDMQQFGDGSGCFQLKVDGEDLKVGMVKLESGVIVELIERNRSEDS